MHRLFVALRPPPAVRGALTGVMGGVPGARWQDDDQLHLTLRFVGEVERPEAEDVAAALGAVSHPPVEVSLSSYGLFDRRGRVDTLWIGAEKSAGLLSLRKKVEQAVHRAGLPHEGRAFLPHVTLARFGRTGDPRPFLAAAPAVAPASWTADAFCLFESRLGSDGAAYEAVARYRLG